MVLPEAVARRFWAYGTLGKTPDEDKWTKLDKDVREVALNMSPDDIGTCMMWALGTILQDADERHVDRAGDRRGGHCV